MEKEEKGVMYISGKNVIVYVKWMDDLVILWICLSEKLLMEFL